MGPREMLLQVSFNQDAGCFAASTTTGFRVYNCAPFCELLRRDLVEFWSGHAAGGGVGAVEMLFRTNVLALIGGGGDPEASKAAVIWDDHKGRCLALLPGGGSPLRGARLHRVYVVAISESRVSVYRFDDLSLQHQYETAPNPRGACALTPVGPAVLACPGPRQGQVRVERLHLAAGDPRRTTIIDGAHPAAPSSAIALSRDGRLVAAAGVGGTDVRVFDTANGTLLQEASLANASEVHGMAFSDDAQYLAAAGDGGVVQVFSLPRADGQAGGASSWFRITGDRERCLVAFGAQNNTVVIVSMGGTFCRCRFDPVKGGLMILLERRKFMS